MTKIIECNSIQAELSYINKLLDQMPAFDILGRLSLESRKTTLTEELSRLDSQWKKNAEIVLYFGGEPVTGSSSIKASFATSALSYFQELVSSVFASKKSNDLSERGSLPFLNESQLSIAGTPRGSFGFILKEEANSETLLDSTLSESIKDVALLIESMSDANIDEKIANIHPRSFKCLKYFFDTLSKNKASISIKGKNINLSIDKDSIQKINEHIETIKEINISTQKIKGIFKGAMALKKKFDFIPIDQSYTNVISGKIADSIEEQFISEMNTEYMDKTCYAEFKIVKTIKTNSSRSNIKWILENIYPEN